VAAQRLADRIHEATGGYAEAHSFGATGQRLDRSWRIIIRLTRDGGELGNDKLQRLLLDTLDSFPRLTDEILRGQTVLT